MKLFSPSASRAIRVLLSNPKKPLTIYRLAKESGVAYSHVHGLVKELLKQGLCWDVGPRKFVLTKPEELLDRWAHYYSYSTFNRITSYYSPETEIEKILRKVTQVAETNDLTYGVTLHAGMSFVHPFVRPVDLHFYIEPGDEEKWVKGLGLELIELGGNIHLARPFDKGVFYGLQNVRKVKVVSNIQLYLDLFNYPARGREAANHLKKWILGE